jgi:hypothetical protein
MAAGNLFFNSSSQGFDQGSGFTTGRGAGGVAGLAGAPGFAPGPAAGTGGLAAGATGFEAVGAAGPPGAVGGAVGVSGFSAAGTPGFSVGLGGAPGSIGVAGTSDCGEAGAGGAGTCCGPGFPDGDLPAVSPGPGSGGCFVSSVIESWWNDDLNGESTLRASLRLNPYTLL